MRTLVIDALTQAVIDAAVRLAKARPVPWKMLEPVALPDTTTAIALSDRKPGTEAIVERSIHVGIPIGFTAAISFEEQPAGLVRHLSVSVDTSRDGKLPSIPHFEEIAKAFGFGGIAAMPNRRMWLEEFNPGERAVNIAELESVNA